jgi:hypothetical protein
MQMVERERFNQDQRDKLYKLSEAMIKRHKKELKGLHMKHHAQRQALILQRRNEFEVIEMRFVNVWNEMMGKFKRELNEMEKNSNVRKMLLKAKNRMDANIF